MKTRVTFETAWFSGPGVFMLDFGREDAETIYFDGQIRAEYEQANHRHARRFVVGYRVEYHNGYPATSGAADSVRIDFYGGGGPLDAAEALRECKRRVKARLLAEGGAA